VLIVLSYTTEFARSIVRQHILVGFSSSKSDYKFIDYDNTCANLRTAFFDFAASFVNAMTFAKVFLGFFGVFVITVINAGAFITIDGVEIPYRWVYGVMPN
jgi:hypothetical protein